MRIFSSLCLVAALALTACLPANGSFGGYTFTRNEIAPTPPVPGPEYMAPVDGSTGVYINGTLLTREQVVLLAAIIKEETIPVGRYYIHANGDMGHEGRAPLGNIIPYIREFEQRHAGGGRRTGGGDDVVINSPRGSTSGTLAISRGCAIASIPGMSISSGC